MKRFIWLISGGLLLLLLGAGTLLGQEVMYSLGPATGATNLQGLGFSWADVNKDGYPDLFVEPDNLCVNNGGTSFSRVGNITRKPFQGIALTI